MSGKSELNKSGDNETTFSETWSLYSTVQLSCLELDEFGDLLFESIFDDVLVREEEEEFEMRAGIISNLILCG